MFKYLNNTQKEEICQEKFVYFRYFIVFYKSTSRFLAK